MTLLATRCGFNVIVTSARPKQLLQIQHSLSTYFRPAFTLGKHKVSMKLFSKNRERLCQRLREVIKTQEPAVVLLQSGDSGTRYCTDTDLLFRQVNTLETRKAFTCSAITVPYCFRNHFSTGRLACWNLTALELSGSRPEKALYSFHVFRILMLCGWASEL